MSVETHVGPYQILRLINRGGQGSVYLGYDKRLQRRVAIKIYSLPSQRAARKQLLREAQLVASMQSHKIVQIYDVIESSGHLALVMEYVPGCDLEEFLTTARPSLASILTIGADIAGALAVARQQHIVHGDLKAANILVTDSGRVKLTDFGIARQMVGSSPQRLDGGTPPALSPEQYRGEPLDGRSDLFALGCLLYRMLGGEAPFLRDGELDIRLLLEQSPRPLAEMVPGEWELPDELVDLVAALLQKRPEDRPANTRQVRQVLRRIARTIPLAATNSLLREARPCFRPESAHDMPPLIPLDLAREGRSRLAPEGAGGVGLRRWALLRSWSARWVVALAALAAIGVPVVTALQRAEPTIYLEEPLLRLGADSELPEQVSTDWLVGEAKLALRQELGTILVLSSTGAERNATLYTSDGPPPEPEERLQLSLRCIEGLCVFAASRAHAGGHANQQAVLFPDMPVEQWRDIVHSATRALY